MAGFQKNIFIVEDEAAILYALQSKLRVEGFAVLTVEDGEKALEMLTNVSPDLIILDLMLPKIDGWEVLRRIKEDKKLQSVPVMIMTNLTDSQNKERGVELGASDYIIKAEYNLDEIVKRVNNLLN